MATILPNHEIATKSGFGSEGSGISMASDVRTIRDLIDRNAETKLDSSFLISPETGEVLSFRILQDRARLLSARLTKGELKPGDKVAFLLDNGLFAAQVFLGTMYGGMVSVPLNVNAGVSQLAYMLDHCDAKVVFVSEEYSALLDEVTSHVERDLKVLQADLGADWGADQSISPVERVPIEPEDVALLMYSSGSTGRPKAAVHSHGALLASAGNSVCSHQLTSADRSLLVLPLYHINAECVTLMPTLLSGGSVVIPRRFSVSRFWDWLDEYGCTWSAVVPTIISQLLDWEDPRGGSREALFRRLRFLRSSSAPLAPSLHREFMEKFDILLIQAMGSSEGGNVFSNPQRPGENKIGSPGLPWGFEAKVLGQDGVELPAGEPGEVVIRGPAMMQGYYKEPEQTAAVLDSDGWLHTGDLAYKDGDGYFFVVGRSKELIIKGGVNIAPRQIDDVLEAHPDVLEAAAIGIPDHHLGEDVVAFVVLRAAGAVTEKDLLSFCESRLGHFKTPTRIHFTNDLPKGPSGKVQRLRLREDLAQSNFTIPPLSSSELSRANGTGDTAAQTDQASVEAVQKIIAECWSEVLEVSIIDQDSNFFVLGGHSLLAVQCLSRLREKIPVSLSLSDFFDNGTVAKQSALVIQRLQSEGRLLTGSLADALKEKSETSSGVYSPIPSRDRSIPYPLSPGQRRLWFAELLASGVPLHNESEAVRLVGDLNFDALESAFRTTVSRREILRTTIEVRDEQPFGVVQEDWRPHIKKIDLRSLAASDRQKELGRLLVDEPQRPFNLQLEPAIRLTLITLGHREHVLILMMHHIICDWASEGILWRDLSALYRSFSRDEPIALPPLALQHGDYATWKAQQSDFDEDLDYWEQNLRGAQELLELPADRARPAVLSYRGARLRARLDATLTAALRDLSQRTETTLFAVFTAAFNLLLHRYSGNDDILLGVPIADRDRQELQGVIGFLLHTHVLRTPIDPEMPFGDLVTLVQRKALELYQHRAVPFERVVEKLRPRRDPSFSPLYQVMFIWRDRDQLLSMIGLEGLEIESLLSESRTSKFDLTLLATDCESEIWLEIEYSSDLFNEARIARMLDHLQTLLGSVALNPGLPLAEVPLIAEPERKTILSDFSQTQAPVSSTDRLHDLIRRQARKTPNAVAASFHGRTMTYQELDQQSDLLARHLQKLGVGPEVLTAVCLERSIEMIIALIAVLKAGGAYVPVDPRYPSDRISFMLEDSGARVVITEAKLAGTIPTSEAQIVRIDGDWPAIVRADDSVLDDGATPEDAAYLIYTSGSTGCPKGVVIPHRAVVNFMLSMSRQPGLSSGDTVVAVTTIAFDIAALELFLPLIVGARVEIASREDSLDPEQLASLIANSRATVMQATPATWRMLIESGWNGDPSLRVLCGGEALSRDLASQLLGRCAELWNMYGPTETTIWSTIDRVKAGDGPVFIGRPIANTQIRILDNKLRPAPIGIPGELFISGMGLARGYLNRPELTAERFLHNPFASSPGARMYRTGDLARYSEDGRIECLGRLDDQVKIRGFRIELGEIEAAMKQHRHIGECVVVAHEESADNRSLIAYFSLRESSAPPTAQDLKAFLRQKLPEYMIPSAFMHLEEFPATPNGKIDRKALAKRKFDVVQREIPKEPLTPRTAQEFQLLQVWKRILGVEEIGLQDNFFDLGGHSLLAVRLVGEINRSFGASLTIPDFFLIPTLEGTLRALDQEENHQSRPKLTRLRSGRAQTPVFFLDASVGMCRLAELLDDGPTSFATSVPIASAVLEAAIENRLADLPRLEELAAPHVELIQRTECFGSCVLVAHSFGGILAFEIARQLRRQNIPVKMIIMLDSWRIPPSWTWSQRLRLMSWTRARWALTWRIRKLQLGAIRITKSMFGSYEAQQDASTVVRADALPTEQVPFEIVRKLYRKMRDEYEWRAVETRAVLFRSRDDKRLAPHHAADGTLGWNGLFELGLEVVECSGDHLSLLGPARVRELSMSVNKCIASVMDSPGRTRPTK